MSTSTTLQADDPAPTQTRPGARQHPVVTLGWMAHWVLRVWLAVFLLVYGWAKVFLVQMGQVDYSDALTGFGEMSPMGLLWRFMAYSPTFQFLSGVAEVAAAVLLLWRPTVGLGALLGAFDMGFVFLLNLEYDVPVKQLSLALAVGCALVAIPYLPRYARALLGHRAVPTGPLPTAIPWPRLHRITRWIGPLFGLTLVIGGGVAFHQQVQGLSERADALPGVYRVVQDAKPAPAQLTDDTRWQQIAFGQWVVDGEGQLSIRMANGELQHGKYAETAPGQLTVQLHPVQHGETPLPLPVERTTTLQWQALPDGRLRVSGDGQDVTVAADPEFRFLFDRDFSWAPRPPANR